MQACRGERLDSGVTLVSHRTRSETDSSSGSTSYKIPTHADFLMAYSSVEGKSHWNCLVFIIWSLQSWPPIVSRSVPFSASYTDFSVSGFFSWRNPEDGTWFIQCLCQELQQNAAKTDLLKLLTNVSRKVALDYQSFNDVIPWQHEQKQVKHNNFFSLLSMSMFCLLTSFFKIFNGH